MTSNAEFEWQTSRTANSQGINTSLTKDACIELELGGKNYSLFDTGSDVTLLPASVVRVLALRPSKTKPLAVNGTNIPILDQATVNVKLSGKKIQFTDLTTQHVDELLLGLALLQEQNAIWKFDSGELLIGERKYQLLDGEKSLHSCRKVGVSHARRGRAA